MVPLLSLAPDCDLLEMCLNQPLGPWIVDETPCKWVLRKYQMEELNQKKKKKIGLLVLWSLQRTHGAVLISVSPRDKEGAGLANT